MKPLRTNALPSRLTQIRSLTSSMPAAWNVRAAMLGQLHGYPLPVHILSHVRRYLDLNSLNSLKEGLKKLRDCAKYASEILTNVPLLKVDRYQLQFNDIQDYITKNMRVFGYDLNEHDLILVSHFVTSAEIMDSSWVLELHDTESSNQIIKLLQLYSTVMDTSGSVSAVLKKEGLQILSTREGEESKYYVPSSDSLETISDITLPPALRRALADELATISKEDVKARRLKTLSTQLSNEAVMYSLADIRLIDHVAMLLQDTKIWATFITPRVKADPSQNLERAKGLRAFSGYLQALLLYPHIFRFELFREGYKSLEEWHGSFPVVPKDVLENYELFIKKYDFLDAAADARSLYQLHQQDSDPNLNSKIYVQFRELSHLYGIDDVIAHVDARKADTSPLRLDYITELKGPKYDHLLLSYPLETFRMLDQVVSRLSERSRFAETSNFVYSWMMPGYTRYFVDEVISTLTNIKFRVPFSWHQRLPASINYDRGCLLNYTKGSYGIRYLAPWATAQNEHALRTVEMYQISTASHLYSKYKGPFAIDTDQAQKLRTALNKQWRTLYPANMMAGERLISPESLKASTIEIQHLLETISNDHITYIVKAFNNDPSLTVWATYLSSFCLMFKKGEGQERGVLVPGLGSPYGMTYQALADLQNFNDEEDLVHIPDTPIYLGFLKKVPRPSENMMIGQFVLLDPYYYFAGNGGKLEVSKFTWGDGLQHFALRPTRDINFHSLYLFDKWYLYDNDTLFIQVDPRATYTTSLNSDEIFTAPLSEASWQGDKVSTNVKFITFGGYGNSPGGGASAPAPGSDSEALTKLINEMDKDMRSSHDDTTVTREAGETAATEIEATVSAGVSSSSTGGKTSSPSKPSKKKAHSEDSPTAEESNPGPIGKVVGKFTDPATKQEIMIIAKDGESADDAIARVAKHHKIDTSSVVRL